MYSPRSYDSRIQGTGSVPARDCHSGSVGQGQRAVVGVYSSGLCDDRRDEDRFLQRNCEYMGF